MKEYKIAKGWRVFTYIFVLVFIFPLGILTFFMIVSLFTKDWSQVSESSLSIYSTTLVTLLFLLLTSGVILMAINIIVKKIIIGEDTFTFKSVFKNKTLHVKQIKGFETTSWGEHSYLFIHLHDSTQKKITIRDYSYFKNYREITNWLEVNFPDFDELRLNQEISEIHQNSEFGENKEERIDNLKKAKRISLITNCVGLAIVVWSFISPKMYAYYVWAYMFFPIVTILIVISQKGMIRINDNTGGSAYPSVAVSIIMTTMMFGFFAFTRFKILDYSNVWLSACVITFGIILLILVGTKEFKVNKKDAFSLFALLIFFFAYSYGVVISLNSFLDNAEVKTSQLKINERVDESDDEVSYYLELENWGSQTEKQEISISKERYDKAHFNHIITVHLYQGRFNVPYYKLAE
jgi:hypothetical protein